VIWAQLSLAFKERALDSYMGYIGQNANVTIQEIKDAMKQQFKRLNSYSQIVNEKKDIKKGPFESVWEENQRLKKIIREDSNMMIRNIWSDSSPCYFPTYEYP